MACRHVAVSHAPEIARVFHETGRALLKQAADGSVIAPENFLRCRAKAAVIDADQRLRRAVDRQKRNAAGVRVEQGAQRLDRDKRDVHAEKEHGFVRRRAEAGMDAAERTARGQLVRHTARAGIITEESK